jgi:hypothetical protein
MAKKFRLYWHIHHANRLLEGSWDVAKRRRFIRNNKTKEEQPTRLRLLQPLQGKPPGDPKLLAVYGRTQAKLDKAEAAFDKAQKAWAIMASNIDARDRQNKLDRLTEAKHKTYDELVNSAAACEHARGRYLNSASPMQINRLHAAQCKDCPWDGRTIFPRPQNPPQTNWPTPKKKAT